MLLLLLNYVVMRALWKIDVYLISTLVNKKSLLLFLYQTDIIIHGFTLNDADADE